MAGFADDASGFDVMYADNVDFSGSLNPQSRILSDGQLLIGSTALPHIRVGTLISPDGSIAITNSSGNISLTGAAQGFQPNVALQEFDDYISNTGQGSKLQWTTTNSGGAVTRDATNGTANNPGIFTFTPAAGASFSFGALQNANSVPLVLGGGAVTCNWVVNLTSLSAGGNTYKFTCGLGGQASIQAPADPLTNGVYFAYTDSVNGGQWQIKSSSASVTTTANTTVVVATGFVTLSIVVNAAATSVAYYINGVQVSVSPITTNIPTTALAPFFMAINTAGTTPQIQCDLWWGTVALSNPRPGPAAGTPPASQRQVLSYTQTAISYQVLGTDAIIGVTSNAAGRTITMPNTNLTTGQVWTIKDEAGTAQSVNNITISGNGKNIDGAATFVINTNFGSVTLYYSGSNFFVR